MTAKNLRLIEPARPDYLRARFIPEDDSPQDGWILTDAGLYAPKRVPSSRLFAAAEDALIDELKGSLDKP